MNPLKRLFSFSDMKTLEGEIRKPEYRCEVGGCSAKYNGFAWYQKHLKKVHCVDLERSAWEASVNASSLNISSATDNPSEVTVHDEGFVVSLTYATVPEEYSNPGSSQPGQTTTTQH